MDELIRELKRQGVLKSPRVEAAFRAIDRKDFVPPRQAAEAYGNYPLPIGHGQTISQPYTVAFMLDLLDPRPGEHILDIGSGSGWTTALLAHVVSNRREKQETPHQNKFGTGQARSKKHGVGKVFALERIPEMCRLGEVNVRTYSFTRKRIAKFFCRDGTLGLAEYAPFDKVLASAAAGRDMPGAWREQLRVGGKIVAPVGGSIWCLTKISPSSWQEQEFPGFSFVPLVNERSKKPAGGEARHGRQEAGSTERKAVIRDREVVNNEQKAGSGGQEAVSKKQGGKNWWRRGLFKSHPGVLLAVLCSLLTIILAAGAYATFAPLAAPRTRADLEVPAGSGSLAIGDLLKSHGVIHSKWAFVAYAALAGSATDLQAGAYTFNGPVTIPEVIRQLVQGERYPNERVITVPEGWDVRDLGRYFAERNLFAADAWWTTVGLPAHDYRGTEAGRPDFSGEFPFLKDTPAYAGLEGYLYPDTYRIFRDATAEDVARKMLSNFDRKLSPELRAEIARQGKAIFEVVTVASLIEKEVVDDGDRRIAAGILWKRLENGMPLQVDASVNYITAKRKSPSAEDLAIDSPFNTYRASGLPLGPIANPGIGAIRAAIFPQKNPYLYYLTAPGGMTIFSLTFEEHVAAKTRYLR